MKLVVAFCACSAALALSGCSSAGRVSRPLSVGNGAGSEYGNYEAVMDGETRGPAGERCVVFNWDRPLTADLALRLRSASCESRTSPGRMVGVELSRTVIPLSESNVRDVLGEAGR